MRGILAAGALALTLLIYLAWPSGSPTKKTSKASPPEAKSPTAQRLTRDAHGLAHALSKVAARTMGTVVIIGQVRDRVSAAPIAHAEVIFSGPSGESSVACDEAGRFRAELMPGLYRSYAQAEGYVAVARAKAERLPGPISAAEVAMPQEGIAPLVAVFRDETGVILSLSPSATLRGRVTDGEGYPIEGAVVHGKNPGLRVISGSDVAESDGSGAYEIVVPAGSIQLEANHEAYAAMAGAAYEYVAPHATKDRDITLARGCIVSGEVVDERGKPVMSGSFERKLPGGEYTPIGKISEGRVRFATRESGSITLRAWPWKSPPSVDKEYQCREGDYYDGEVFVIPDLEPSLTGYITDVDGAPIPYAYIDLFGLETGGATQQERADSEGNFAFFTVPDGPYQLSAYVPGSGATVELTSVPSTGVPLQLGGVGTILGRVSGMDSGSLQMHYRCTFKFDDETAVSDALSMPEQTLLVPVSGGSFRIDDVPVCTIEARISGEGLYRVLTVDVQEGQDAVIQLEAGG